MKLLVFSVFDAAVNAFMPPFYMRTKGEAIRAFTEASNDASKPFKANKTDYALFLLGVWDDATGLTECPMVAERVIGAHELEAEVLR